MKKTLSEIPHTAVFSLLAVPLLWFLTLTPLPAATKIQVVCTLPTLKSFTEEVGGDRVDVISLARGDQDPHFVTPTPVLMKRTRDAILFIENGLSLELWADGVVNGSGNSRIFRGTRGRIIASNGVSALELPSVLTRCIGGVHPE